MVDLETPSLIDPQAQVHPAAWVAEKASRVKFSGLTGEMDAGQVDILVAGVGTGVACGRGAGATSFVVFGARTRFRSGCGTRR